MTNFIIIRAHGCTVKDQKEIINLEDENVVFQCSIGEKVPYWPNLQDGALGFIKKCISLYPDFKGGYRYLTSEEIPKTLLSGIDNIEYNTCYQPFKKWVLNKYEEKTTDYFILNGFLVLWSLFIEENNQILHCTIGGSRDDSTLTELINTLKEKFPSYNNVWIVPICRTVVDDIVIDIDTPIIESSGHFSYKICLNQDYLEDILSAIERNDKQELNNIYFYFLENSTKIEKENLKQKVLNDYKGLNVPKTAEKVLDYIDISLLGKDEYYEDLYLDYHF